MQLVGPTIDQHNLPWSDLRSKGDRVSQPIFPPSQAAEPRPTRAAIASKETGFCECNIG